MSENADERLIHDHAELGHLLNQLNVALNSNDIARTHVALDLFWARLAVHIRAEHLHLFPTILRAASRSLSEPPEGILPAGEPGNTIDDLRRDHDFFMRELSQAIAITRGLLANFERDTTAQLGEVKNRIVAVRDRLIKHNEIEETGIYLWSSSLLNDSERAELTSQVQKELENLPPRFGV
jgi:hypothetical protein